MSGDRPSPGDDRPTPGGGGPGHSASSIRFIDDPWSVETADLEGFWEGWPTPPSRERHLTALRGAEAVVLALDEGSGRVVGFVTAVGDGTLTAFIPLLEVLPEYRGRGIGRELIRRVVEALQPRYSVDLVCDDDLIAYYERSGFVRLTAMGMRDRAALP